MDNSLHNKKAQLFTMHITKVGFTNKGYAIIELVVENNHINQNRLVNFLKKCFKNLSWINQSINPYSILMLVDLNM